MSRADKERTCLLQENKSFKRFKRLQFYLPTYFIHKLIKNSSYSALSACVMTFKRWNLFAILFCISIDLWMVWRYSVERFLLMLMNDLRVMRNTKLPKATLIKDQSKSVSIKIHFILFRRVIEHVENMFTINNEFSLISIYFRSTYI